MPPFSLVGDEKDGRFSVEVILAQNFFKELPVDIDYHEKNKEQLCQRMATSCNFIGVYIYENYLFFNLVL